MGAGCAPRRPGLQSYTLFEKGLELDTLEACYEGKVRGQPAPAYAGAWAYLRFRAPENVTLEAVALHLRIREAASGQVFSTVLQGAALTGVVSTSPFCDGGGCVTSFTVDLRPATLQGYLPPGFPGAYEAGDSLKLWLQVRIQKVTVIEVQAQVEPCLIVTTDPGSPPPMRIHAVFFFSFHLSRAFL